MGTKYSSNINKANIIHEKNSGEVNETVIFSILTLLLIGIYCNTEEVNQSTDYIGDMDSFDRDSGTIIQR